MTQAAELTGKFMAGQSVLGRAPSKKGKNSKGARWHCLCSCGKECVKETQQLTHAAKYGKVVYCSGACATLQARLRESAELGTAVGKSHLLEPVHMASVKLDACFWCGDPGTEKKPNHIKRISPAAPWTRANTISSCPRCSAMRGGMHVSHFLASVRAIIRRHGPGEDRLE